MKRVYIFTAFIVYLFSVYLYFFQKESYIGYDYHLRDQMFLQRGTKPVSGLITIVDIDEKSLAVMGQWPWGREEIAQILYNLTNAGAGIISLDVFFAEKEKNGNDPLLAKALSETPSLTSYLFLRDENITKNILPNKPFIVIEKGLETEYLDSAMGYISNIPLLSKSAYSSGFINTTPNHTGLVNYSPLFMKFNDIIYPSLVFEMFRLSREVGAVSVNYSQAGVENIEVGDVVIPTDRFGRLFVNYRGPKKHFDYVSASDVYQNNFDKSKIEGRFVFIGTSSMGLFDLRSTPFDSAMPGVEIHANILDNLLQQDFIFQPSESEFFMLFILFFITVILLLIFLYLKPIMLFFSSTGLIIGYYYLNYYFLFQKGLIFEVFLPIFLALFLTVLFGFFNYFFESKKSRIIKEEFSKKVSKEVVDELLDVSHNRNILAAKNKEVSIFFSDVRSFTAISEKLDDPERLITLLNIYLTPMVDIIMKYQGTIDKFIGDAIMAYWNAPHSVSDHADQALSAAIDQLRELKVVNRRLKVEFDLEIDIGIGINSGIVTVGEMGTTNRSDFTVIGDNVNLASRLEGLNKAYHAHLIISENTKKRLKKSYPIRELDLIRVKGKKRPTKIYEVVVDQENSETFFSQTLRFYRGVVLYRQGRFLEALDKFCYLFEEYGDPLFSVYIQRCEHYLKYPPESFDGVFTFTTK